jgi:hypothetical protein
LISSPHTSRLGRSLQRGLTVNDYIASQDIVSGTVYLALLAVFAVMPLLVRRR